MKKKSKPSIKYWSPDERPREKLVQIGPRHLTEAELIGILLGTGSQVHSALGLGREVLDAFGGLRNLAKADVSEICQIKGVGLAKAATLSAAFELGRRKLQSPDFYDRMNSSRRTAMYLRPYLIDLKQEEFIVLYLNNDCRLLGQRTVSLGGISGTLIDPKVVFKEAVMLHSSCLVLAHNHPSGNPKPSRADLSLTEKLIQGARLMDVKLLDHLILSHDSYFSFEDKGIMRELRANVEL